MFRLYFRHFSEGALIINCDKCTPPCIAAIIAVKGEDVFLGFSGGLAVKLFYLLSEKGSTLKGTNLKGATSFLLEQTTFQKGLGVQEGNEEATKTLSPLQ